MDTIVLVQLVAAAWMTAVIWITQRITYPGFTDWSRDEFARCHADYVRRIGPIVMPAMMLELLAAAAWLFTSTGGARYAAIAGMVLVAVLWISTFALQVPCHNRLSSGFDAATHARLVATNWIRTVAWTLRLGLLIYVIT